MAQNIKDEFFDIVRRGEKDTFITETLAVAELVVYARTSDAPTREVFNGIAGVDIQPTGPVAEADLITLLTLVRDFNSDSPTTEQKRWKPPEGPHR